MTAQELRICNLVLNDGVVNEVVGLLCDGVATLKTLQGNYIHGRYELLKGIPLTEEWVNRLRFQHHEEGTYFYRPEHYKLSEVFLSILFEDGDIFIHLVQYDEGTGSNHIIELSRELKYVHEIQNLAYAIKGEELTIQVNAPV